MRLSLGKFLRKMASVFIFINDATHENIFQSKWRRDIGMLATTYIFVAYELWAYPSFRRFLLIFE